MRRPRGEIARPKGVRRVDDVQLFDRIAEEVLHRERNLFDELSEYERGLVVKWLSDAIVDDEGWSAVHDVLWETDFHRKPVDIDTFIHDEYYLGRAASGLHPAWKEDLYQVFAPGSSVFEWVMCLSGDTVVPLLDGTEATLQELHERWEGNPTPFWVYSYSRYGWVMPAECTRVTRFAKDQLYRVALDDGTSVRANADHEFVCRDGVKRKLRDLQVGDRLMPFHTRFQKIGKTCEYEQVYHPEVQRYEFTHRAVGRYVAGGKTPKEVNGQRATVHHRDINRFNNCPGNLEWMGWEDHAAWHREHGWSEERRAMLSARQKKVACDPDSPLRKGLKAFMNSEAGRALARVNLAKARVTTEERLLRLLKASESRWSDPDQRRRAAKRCRKRSLGNDWGKLSTRVRRDVTADDIYEAYEREGTLARTYACLGVSRNAAVRILRDAGLTLDHVRCAYRNHRVVSIEPDGVEHVYCLTVPKYENFAVSTDGKRRGIFSGNTGAIGTGKTTLADVALTYKIYYLSCLRDAAAYYGLLSGSQIVFGVYSITKRQVADAGYYKLRGYIDSSPYFRNEFPRSTKIDSKIDFERSTGRQYTVIPGSQELHALGLDLFSFLMDEVNFMRVKDNKEAGVQAGQAYTLYNATFTRLQSRFIRPGGSLPGIMLLLSSRNAQTSFLEEHLKKVKGSPATHVSDYALWDVKSKTKFTLPPFNVEVGDRLSQSRVLKEEEVPRKDAKIVTVPGEFRKPFTEDTDQALRDIAGVATFNVSPLIRDRQSVRDAVHPQMEHPFTREVLIISCDDDVLLEDYFDIRKLCRTKRSKWLPILNPNHPRFIHIDIGLTGDALGFAMGHVAGRVRNRRMRPDGTMSEVSSTYDIIDMMARVIPPPGEEVELEKVRAFVVYLSRIFTIERVTFDGFQSRGSIQMLRREGVEAGELSVDRTDEAYLALRLALFERRISCYEYEPFMSEVLDLERDLKERKVDHPTRSSSGGKGSKDVSDGVAGVVWHLTNDPRATSVPMLPDLGEGDLDDLLDSGRNGRGKRNGREGSVTREAVAVAPSQVSVPGARRVGKKGPKWEELRRNVRR